MHEATEHWVEKRVAAATPLALVFVLIAFYGAFQKAFIECPKDGIGRCQPFVASHVYPLDKTEPLDENGEVWKGDGNDDTASRNKLAARYGGRLVWVFLSAVTSLLSLAALVVAGVLIYKSPGFWKMGPGASAAAALIVSSALGLMLYLFFWRDFMPIMGPVFEATIAAGKVGVPVVGQTMRLLNALGYAASFALVFATCAILLPRHLNAQSARDGRPPPVTQRGETDQADVSRKLDILAAQAAGLRVVLYVGTFLLIAGILRMSALGQWVISYVAPSAVAAAQNLNTAVVAVTGGFYTLILAAVYLPSAYIISRRAWVVVGRSTIANPADAQATKLQERGLAFSFKESLPRVLAVLGPLLAGPIGELFKSLLPK
jgi:hypothetical protein